MNQRDASPLLVLSPPGSGPWRALAGRFLAPLALLLALGTARPATAQATFVVTSFDDAVDAAPGNGVCATAAGACTLRAAITEANALAGTDTIQLQAGTYALTITGTNEDQNVSGDLDLRSDLTLLGDPTGGSTITAAGIPNQRVMHVPVAAAVTLRDLTLTGGALTGTTTTSAGAGLRVQSGAVVFLEGSAITGNTTASEGGGVYATGDGSAVTLTRTTVSANSTTGTSGFGGGLRTAVNASLHLTECTVSGNTATAAGGGLNHGTSGGTVTIERSLFANNTAVSQHTGGGAVSFGGPGRVLNSTFSGNAVSHPTPGPNQGGGALWVSPLNASVVVDVEFSTFAGNTAVHTGGAIRRQGTAGALNLRNNVIGDNALASDTATARRDLGGTGAFNLAGYNLVEDGTGFASTETQDAGTNTLGADPMLGPLADNGGPTMTHALMAGSPAVNTGTCTRIDGTAVAVDQRGFPRTLSPCDRGAYEFNVITPGTETAAAGLPLTLSAVHPNPARADAAFELVARAPTHVRAELLDGLGRRVAVLFEGAVAPGRPVTVRIDGAGLAAGPYVVRAVGTGADRGTRTLTSRLTIAR